MNGQSQTISSASKEKQSQKRQRSTIAFPYMDLESAMQMVMAIHNNVGHGDCDDDQLAAWTNQSNKSSTFRVQVYTARTFNLIEAVDGGRHKLTELGRKIVDPAQERQAKVEAFLNVELYNAAYEKYKGCTIPPAAALERDMVSLGVAEKQKDRARQAFERSAQQAGFFEQGNNRLVKPGINATKNNNHNPPNNKEEPPHHGGGGGNGVDPLIDALIRKLPTTGKTWEADQRVTWLQMVSMAFQMAYGNVAQIEIKKIADSSTG